MVAEFDGDRAADVEPGLAGGLPAAHDQVVDLARVEGRDLVQGGADHLRRQIVGPHVGQRPLTAQPIGERAVATMTASGMELS